MDRTQQELSFTSHSNKDELDNVPNRELMRYLFLASLIYEHVVKKINPTIAKVLLNSQEQVNRMRQDAKNCGYTEKDTEGVLIFLHAKFSMDDTSSATSLMQSILNWEAPTRENGRS
jgi:hypothetical protein